MGGRSRSSSGSRHGSPPALEVIDVSIYDEKPVHTAGQIVQEAQRIAVLAERPTLDRARSLRAEAVHFNALCATRAPCAMSVRLRNNATALRAKTTSGSNSRR
eukprot:3649238-Pyramimonas_sp.AAC.1